jgi:hypothetical protein
MNRAAGRIAALHVPLDGHHVPYQTSLRVIGDFLDGHSPCKARVIEVPHGFEVSSQPSHGEGEPARRLFSHEELRSQAEKPCLRTIPGQGKSVSPRTEYQELFRAIGYELETWEVYLILLDELDDGFLLTYQYYSRDSGLILHKRHVVVRQEDGAILLRSAIARRGRQG